MRCRLWTQSAEVWPATSGSAFVDAAVDADCGKAWRNDSGKEETCCDSMAIGSPVTSSSRADLALEAASIQITPTVVGVAT
jgi:hypothetical protein